MNNYCPIKNIEYDLNVESDDNTEIEYCLFCGMHLDDDEHKVSYYEDED